MLVHTAAAVNPSCRVVRISIMRATRNVYRWRAVDGTRLSPAACALYLLWCTYLDSAGSTPRWLTVERMADDIGHSERQTQRAARELVAHGLAEEVRRSHQATVYRPREIPDTRVRKMSSRPDDDLARDVGGGDIAGAPGVTPEAPLRVTPVSPNQDSEISNSISLSNSAAPHERADVVAEVARRAGCALEEARDRIELAFADGRGERYGWSIGYLVSWTRRGMELAAGRSSSPMPQRGRAGGAGGKEEQPVGRYQRFASSTVLPSCDDEATREGLAMLRATLERRR